MEDKTYQENDDVFDEDATVTSDNDTTDAGEDYSTAEGDESEDETLTLTQSELDERIKAARKEQDKRWKARLKEAGAEDGQEGRKEGGKKDRKEVDERYERLELKTEGVKDKDQQDFVLDYARLKNISVTDALATKVVQAELRDMQETTRKKQAVPSSSSRTAQPKKDDVSYWATQFTEKGKQAPTVEMRRKVRKYLAGS